MAVAIALPVSSGPTCVAQETQPATSTRATQTKLPELLKNLNSNKRAVRISAERQFIQLGTACLPFVEEQQTNPDNDSAIRAALSRIYAAIQRNSAQNSLRPTVLQLPVTAVSATKTIDVDELFAATGNRLVAKEPLRLSFQKTNTEQTFWKTILLARQQSKLTIHEQRTPRAVVLRDANAVPPDAAATLQFSESGPFLVRLNSAKQRTSTAQRRGRIRFSVSVFAEPRLRVLFLKKQSKNLTLYSGNDTLPLVSPAASQEYSATAGMRFDFHEDFHLPSAASSEKSLQQWQLMGRVVVQVAAGEEQFRWPATADYVDVVRSKSGINVRLLAIEKNRTRNETQIRIRVEWQRGGPAFESYRAWVLHNAAWLEQPDGRRIDPVRLPTYERQADGSAEVRYAVPANDVSKMRFVYSAPVLLLNYPIDFTFADPQTTGDQRSHKTGSAR